MSNNAYVYGGRSAGTTTYENNSLNQLIDENGILTASNGRGDLTSDGTRSYSYNAYGQLTGSATTPGNFTTTYDPAGRLYSLNGGGNPNVRFQYDGLQLAAEYQSNDTTLLRRHVPGPGLDKVLLTYEGSGVTDRTWYMADERGSVIGAMRANGGTTTYTANAYDEYGVPASGNTGRFQYTGQVRLPGDLYHYRARAYEPTLGRFLQPDPIGYEAGLNLYAYVGGDPVNLVDPLGLQEAHPPLTGL